MTYHLELPREIERDLTAHAAATGQDVAQLIQVAIVRYVERDVRSLRSPGLLPDPPLESEEISPPVELPFSGSRQPVSVSREPSARLRPDSLPIDE
ncbi:MAG: hypothetical protein ACK5Q5_04170 [Planctomycetaceae bacterium]